MSQRLPGIAALKLYHIFASYFLARVWLPGMMCSRLLRVPLHLAQFRRRFAITSPGGTSLWSRRWGRGRQGNSQHTGDFFDLRNLASNSHTRFNKNGFIVHDSPTFFAYHLTFFLWMSIFFSPSILSFLDVEPFLCIVTGVSSLQGWCGQWNVAVKLWLHLVRESLWPGFATVGWVDGRCHEPILGETKLIGQWHLEARLRQVDARCTRKWWQQEQLQPEGFVVPFFLAANVIFSLVDGFLGSRTFFQID